MKIVILLIATGKYIKFFKQFYESSEKYFLKGHEKTYILFTDKINETIGLPDNVITIYQAWEPWPSPTLYRYRYFMNAVQVLETTDSDYMFYSDVDMRFNNAVGEEIFSDALMAVLHPGFYNTNKPQGTLETNPKSKAFISPNDQEQHRYVCGGFQGGRTKSYLRAIKTMRDAIDVDVSNGIIPVFHDETMWNKLVYLNRNTNVLFMTPEYCYPESWGDHPNLKGLVPRLLALDKNHAEMRTG